MTMTKDELLTSLRVAKMCENCRWFKTDNFSGKLYCHHPLLIIDNRENGVEIPSGTSVCDNHIEID